VERDVAMRHDGVDAPQLLGRSGVQLRDSRVVGRRAQRSRPEHAGDAHVVDVGGATGDVRDAVVTRNARADRLHSPPPARLVVYLPAAVVDTSNESPRAAAATASMILT